jgi:hypothetical protein
MIQGYLWEEPQRGARSDRAPLERHPVDHQEEGFPMTTEEKQIDPALAMLNLTVRITTPPTPPPSLVEVQLIVAALANFRMTVRLLFQADALARGVEWYDIEARTMEATQAFARSVFQGLGVEVSAGAG